jgi:putative ABC transport system permease protein
MLSIIGLGLLLRKILQRTNIQRATQSRVAGSFEGGALMIFWGLPFDYLEPLTGELSFGPELFVLSGASMVGASVWLVMHNTQIILSVLNLTLGRITKLRAVFKVAVAYPFAAPLRTGLTISMFSMVIFTLMINMVLSNLDNVGRSDPDRITGGFDIVATTSEDLPIADFKASVAKTDILNPNDFVAVGRSTNFPVIARQDGGETRVFKRLGVKIVDDSYLTSIAHGFSTFDKAYGINEREIWDQLRDNPDLAVLSHAAIATGDPFSGPNSGFQVEGFDQASGDTEWKTISIQLRPLGDSDQIINRKVIGILDPVVDQSDWQSPTYLLTKDDMLTELTGEPAVFDTYSIKLSDPGVTTEIIPLIETVFLENGLDAVSLLDQINESLESSEAFNKLFQGFTGLGLFVGIAAIGVLAIRAVVERRASIATLRAIGYTPRMIQAQFLIEAVFITLMGVIIGMSLGALTSWNIYTEISKEVQGLQFTVPWRNVLGLIALTSICAILSAYIPARQASRIYPAEALRTE